MNHYPQHPRTQTASISISVSIGSALAMLISWSHTHSVLWTIFHGILGWFYVIFALLTGKAHL